MNKGKYGIYKGLTIREVCLVKAAIEKVVAKKWMV
jgi:hypothetical protein